MGNKKVMVNEEQFDVLIEISARSSPVKYELDKDSGLLSVDRFIATSMVYPCDYGFIPNTLGDDGDPIDVLVVAPSPLLPGVSIKVRAVGMLVMTDDGGVDHKVLTVPVSKLTPIYDDIQQYHQLPKLLLEEIAHFFKHYKDLEPGKWAKIDGWEKADVAKSLINASIEAYQSQSKT